MWKRGHTGVAIPRGRALGGTGTITEKKKRPCKKSQKPETLFELDRPCEKQRDLEDRLNKGEKHLQGKTRSGEGWKKILSAKKEY